MQAKLYIPTTDDIMLACRATDCKFQLKHGRIVYLGKRYRGENPRGSAHVRRETLLPCAVDFSVLFLHRQPIENRANS